VPEDRQSPWSRPGPASPDLSGMSPTSYPPAPYAAAPALSQAGSAVPPVQVHVTAAAAPRGGLAVVGIVLAGLALVLALVALVVGAFLALASDPGGGYGLRGTITPMNGRALTGPALAAEIATKVSEDGGEPEGITCPATAKVAQDVTTVCHGSDYGTSSTFVVFFEDARGAYTLLEI
jgi:hypothetical protein